MELLKVIEDEIENIKNLRLDLNKNAELSFKEYKTHDIIVNYLNNIGIETSTMIGTGVVATLNQGQKCIAIRADIDALPVNGVSHACGHDFHIAIALGVAKVLKVIGYDKCVKFMFEPGEESQGGALPMIKEGVLLNPDVKKILGFHVWPNVKVGTIEVVSGASMASVDDFYINFKGRGGHAAIPELCINPIEPAMEFVNSIKEFKENIKEEHVLTVTSIDCKNATNVIGDICEVSGTVRTFNRELREILHKKLMKSSKNVAEKYGCDVEFKYDFQYPPLLNDEKLTNDFINITQELIGKNNVKCLKKTFAGEDFAFFAEKVPAVHFRIGIDDGEKGVHALHSSKFNGSEEAILNGIYIITNYIMNSGI